MLETEGLYRLLQCLLLLQNAFVGSHHVWERGRKDWESEGRREKKKRKRTSKSRLDSAELIVLLLDVVQ